MRIFAGIDLDPEIRARIEGFVEQIHSFAPEARWMRPESLHITLKFIGEQPEARLDEITARLTQVNGTPFEIRVAGHGFFPNAKASRVFWIGIHAGPELTELAARIDLATTELGVPREDRPYSPHLTLARAPAKSGSPKRQKDDSPNAIFAGLQKRLDATGELDFGTMMANEFILYQSQLSPSGSKYTTLKRFPLRSLEKD